MNETQTDTKQKPKPPAIEVTETKKPPRETIAVKNLTFYQPHPNFNARNSLASESAANKGRVTIDFNPSMRHHRVEQFQIGGGSKVRFVHESSVADWEPLG
jgi:hypothetical protein